MQFGAVVQRIGHIPSKDTMLVRFQPALPAKADKINHVSKAKTPVNQGFLLVQKQKCAQNAAFISDKKVRFE